MNVEIMSFLCRAAGVDGCDPEEPVSITALLDRLGWVPDPDPESAEWTLDELRERYCAAGSDVVPFKMVSVVLMHLGASEFGAEWREDQLAFFEWGCELLNAEAANLFADSGLDLALGFTVPGHA
jgi:hypothetical protein